MSRGQLVAARCSGRCSAEGPRHVHTTLTCGRPAAAAAAAPPPPPPAQRHEHLLPPPCPAGAPALYSQVDPLRSGPAHTTTCRCRWRHIDTWLCMRVVKACQDGGWARQGRVAHTLTYVPYLLRHALPRASLCRLPLSLRRSQLRRGEQRVAVVAEAHAAGPVPLAARAVHAWSKGGTRRHRVAALPLPAMHANNSRGRRCCRPQPPRCVSNPPARTIGGDAEGRAILHVVAAAAGAAAAAPRLLQLLHFASVAAWRSGRQHGAGLWQREGRPRRGERAAAGGAVRRVAAGLPPVHRKASPLAWAVRNAWFPAPGTTSGAGSEARRV